MGIKQPRIDLFSDTKTRPSEEMLKAMVEANVGDEQADEDPTTLFLCEKVAELTGKQTAIFLPSGTMCNQGSLAVWCHAGDEIIADSTAHIINYEAGGVASIARAMVRTIEGEHGIFTASQLEDTLRPVMRHMPKSKLVSVEQTSNLGGGTIWPLLNIKEISEVARSNNLITHMDGARLMNAVVASGISAAEYASYMDSVWIDLSKGLGCPVGGVLAGTNDFIEQAWDWKQRLGGSMRQSGILAAAGIYALDNNVERMAEDHENAKIIGTHLSGIEGLEIDIQSIQTNIIIFKVVSKSLNAVDLGLHLEARGIRIGVMNERTVRIVTHLDVDRSAVIEFTKAIEDVMIQGKKYRK